MNISVDGQELKVDWYVDNYVKYPNRPQDQLINIYVPENAVNLYKSSLLMIFIFCPLTLLYHLFLKLCKMGKSFDNALYEKYSFPLLLSTSFTSLNEW